MQAIIAAAENDPARRLLTVKDFLALHEAGAFEGLRHVELIEEKIFVMAPLRHPHARAQIVLSTAVDLAVEQFGEEWQALAPMSAQLDANSLPEADIIVAYAPGDRFITPETVRLLIEVSSTSPRHDLGRKLRLYAHRRARILGGERERPADHPLPSAPKAKGIANARRSPSAIPCRPPPSPV